MGGATSSISTSPHMHFEVCLVSTMLGNTRVGAERPRKEQKPPERKSETRDGGRTKKKLTVSPWFHDFDNRRVAVTSHDVARLGRHRQGGNPEDEFLLST